MLVQLTDTKGKEHWINPLYVKAIVARKKDQAEIFISFGSPLSAKHSIKVDQNAATVAQIISDVLATMNNAFSNATALAEEDLTARALAQQQAALGAATMGG